MKSLRRALFAYILGGLLLVLLLTGVAVYVVARSNLRAQLDEALVARARTFAALVVEEDGGLEFDYDGSIREEDAGVLVRVTTADGNPVAQSPGWPAELQRPDPMGPAAPTLRSLRLRTGEAARAVAIAVGAMLDPDDPRAPGERSGQTIVVEVIGRTGSVRAAESAVLGALVAGSLLAAAGTAAAVWIGIRRGLGPVRRLGSELDRIDARDPALPATADTYPEELQPIIAALDELLDRLRAAMQRERRFTDAAAHELRTPIAELRTIADVAARWPDGERLRHCVIETGSIAEEMEALLETLLAAARGGTAYAAHPAESVALLPLARAVAARELDGLHRRSVSCGFQGDENASWIGPRGAILAIVRNVVQNAAEYTADGGAVRISAMTSGTSTVFEAENGPVSLRPADVDRMFEPFWRAEESRSDRTHRGLGLSIVASLCDSLNLRRQVALTPDRALRVRLTS